MYTSGISIELIKAVFMESGSYHQMGLRPYTFAAGGNAHNQFLNATDGGVNLEPIAVASVATQILHPHPQHVQQTDIDGGWGEKRFMFMMRFRVYQDSAYGRQTRNDVVVQGMTSHVGVNRDLDSLAPEMRIYFNNITRLEPYVVNTPYGDRTAYRPRESSQIIRNEPQMQMGQTTGSRFTMRPQDIYGTMGLKSLGDLGSEVFDTRNTFSSNQAVMKSNRKNACSPYYLTNIAKSYYYSVPDDYTGIVSADDDVDVYDNYSAARQKSMQLEGTPSTDLFMMALGENYQRMGYITAGELAYKTPNLNDSRFTQVILDKSQGVIRSSIAPTTDAVNYSNHWNGANQETLWSNMMVQSVPALMVDFLITNCSFTVTNRTRDGQIALQFTSAHPFIDEMDIAPMLPRLQERLISEIFQGLSMNNTMDFAVIMEVNMSSDTRVSISIAGGPEEIFIAPSFCDSIYAPVSTFNNNDVFALCNDMSGFIDSIKNDTSAFSNYGFDPNQSMYG